MQNGQGLNQSYTNQILSAFWYVGGLYNQSLCEEPEQAAPHCTRTAALKVPVRTKAHSSWISHLTSFSRCEVRCVYVLVRWKHWASYVLPPAGSTQAGQGCTCGWALREYLPSHSYLAVPRFTSCRLGLEIRLWRQQRHPFGRQGSGRWWFGGARANLRALVWERVFGKLLDPRLERRSELWGRGRLLAQVPHGPVEVVIIERVGRCGRGGQGEGEREGGAGVGGVGGDAAVQQSGQLQAFEDRFAYGETLGVTLENDSCLLRSSGSPISLP